MNHCGRHGQKDRPNEEEIDGDCRNAYELLNRDGRLASKIIEKASEMGQGVLTQACRALGRADRSIPQKFFR